MQKPYFYLEGIRQLSKELLGNENIYLGIRPYGFHAGNELALVVYPYLLCEELKNLGKIPRFNIYLFINDWEQYRLNGPNLMKYPFNIYPDETTFQHIYTSKAKTKSIVDFWEAKIKKEVMFIKKKFPKVLIKSIRNSELKNNLIMKKTILKTIKHPEILGNILRNRGYVVLDEPLVFSLAICPNCKTAKGISKVVKKDKIMHFCKHCFKVYKANYEAFDYWLYHKPLALPRLKIFNIDICITGSDHYKEGDFIIRQKLIKNYKFNIKLPKILHTQLVKSSDNQPMGKSRGNDKYVPIKDLIQIVKKSNNSTIVIK